MNDTNSLQLLSARRKILRYFKKSLKSKCPTAFKRLSRNKLEVPLVAHIYKYTSDFFVYLEFSVNNKKEAKTIIEEISKLWFIKNVFIDQSFVFPNSIDFTVNVDFSFEYCASFMGKDERLISVIRETREIILSKVKNKKYLPDEVYRLIVEIKDSEIVFSFRFAYHVSELSDVTNILDGLEKEEVFYFIGNVKDAYFNAGKLAFIIPVYIKNEDLLK